MWLTVDDAIVAVAAVSFLAAPEAATAVLDCLFVAVVVVRFGLCLSQIVEVLLLLLLLLLLLDLDGRDVAVIVDFLADVIAVGVGLLAATAVAAAVLDFPFVVFAVILFAFVVPGGNYCCSC